jgi:hypothetical protein
MAPQIVASILDQINSKMFLREEWIYQATLICQQYISSIIWDTGRRMEKKRVKHIALTVVP